MTSRIFWNFTPDHLLKARGILADVVEHTCCVRVFVECSIRWTCAVREVFRDAGNVSEVLSQWLPVGIGIRLAQTLGIGVCPIGIARDIRAGN